MERLSQQVPSCKSSENIRVLLLEGVFSQTVTDRTFTYLNRIFNSKKKITPGEIELITNAQIPGLACLRLLMFSVQKPREAARPTSFPRRA
jgi:hypothetical protein